MDRYRHVIIEDHIFCKESVNIFLGKLSTSTTSTNAAAVSASNTSSPSVTSATRSFGLSGGGIAEVVIAPLVVVLSVLLGFYIQKRRASQTPRTRVVGGHGEHGGGIWNGNGLTNDSPNATLFKAPTNPLRVEADSIARHKVGPAMRHEKGG